MDYSVPELGIIQQKRCENTTMACLTDYFNNSPEKSEETTKKSIQRGSLPVEIRNWNPQSTYKEY
jgi:hypothetical protein